MDTGVTGPWFRQEPGEGSRGAGNGSIPGFIAAQSLSLICEALMSTTTAAPKGLEGIVAANSSICYIDGDAGILAYRGFDIHDLAVHSTFEEVCYLLWFGRLPNRQELQDLSISLWRESKLDAGIISLLRQAPGHTLPMDVLRTVVSALAWFDPEEKCNDHGCNIRKAIRLTSQISM